METTEAGSVLLDGPQTNIDPLRDMGQMIGYDKIVSGLREMNPEIVFDFGPQHGLWHPRESEFANCRFGDRSLGSISRGMVPEFTQRQVAMKLSEVTASEALKADEKAIQFARVVYLPTAAMWEFFAAMLQTKDSDVWTDPTSGTEKLVQLEADGSISVFSFMMQKAVPGRVVLKGWRALFERIVRARIPGVTREKIAEKFRVNMDLRWLGTPSQLMED